jgi:hypothetical protein
MVQPYDYTLKTPSPGETFFKAVQLGQQQQQADAQRLRAEAERAEIQRKIDAEAQKVRIFKEKLGPGATVESRNEAMRELGPDYVNAVKSAYDVLDEGRKNFFLETARKVYNRLGTNKDGVVDIQSAVDELNLRADAAKNSGYTEVEQQFRDLSKAISNPGVDPRAAQGFIDFQVRAVNPKAADEMTGFGDAANKLRAAGIEPFSKRGQEILSNIAITQGDTFVSGVMTPNNTVFNGPLSLYLELYGTPSSGEPAPAAKPKVYSNVQAIPADLKIGDIVNGQEYVGGPVTGSPDSWRKPKGGQTATPSGNFQGQ